MKANQSAIGAALIAGALTYAIADSMTADKAQSKHDDPPPDNKDEKTDPDPE